MFTGIIEEIGTVKQIQKQSVFARLTVEASAILSDIHIGDSIAVNGVCLTVTSFCPTSFTADVMHETLRRSSLGHLHTGSPVNLERAMQAQGRFGGHIVSGHIDGTGVITEIKNDGNAIWFTIRTGPDLLRYIIQKGSVAINGISLTVAAVTDRNFSVSVIPHTAQCTILSSARTGDTVNIENDCIGKYVEKLLNAPSAQQTDFTAHKTGITQEMLSGYGF